MEPLKTNRRILTWVSAYSIDQNNNKVKHLAYSIFTLFILVANLCGLVSSIAFFIENYSIDLEASLVTLSQIGGFSNMAYMIVTAVILRQKFTRIFEQLLTIYKDRKLI